MLGRSSFFLCLPLDQGRDKLLTRARIKNEIYRNCEAMSRDFPDMIDPWKAADGRRRFHGTMPLQRMKRLEAVLALNSGEAGFDARFYYDLQNILVVDLSVEADLQLICQRSLLPYSEPVRRRSLLAVVETMAEQELLPENYEPILVEQKRIALLELVEDELLLGVPLVPRDPAVNEIRLSTDGAVAPESEPDDEPLQRPFADLADLMKEKAQD